MTAKECPREPTQAMMDAARDYLPMGIWPGSLLIRGTFRAMYDAAPSAPEQEPEWSDDLMCPNCVTPWKCNGPHIPQDVKTAPAAAPDADTDALIARLNQVRSTCRNHPTFWDFNLADTCEEAAAALRAAMERIAELERNAHD